MNIHQLRDHVNSAISNVKTKEELASAIEIINGELNQHQKMLTATTHFPLESQAIRGVDSVELARIKAIYLNMTKEAVSRYGYQSVARILVNGNLEVARSRLTVRTIMLDIAQDLDRLETNWWKKIVQRRESLYEMVNAQFFNNKEELTNGVTT